MTVSRETMRPGTADRFGVGFSADPALAVQIMAFCAVQAVMQQVADMPPTGPSGSLDLHDHFPDVLDAGGSKSLIHGCTSRAIVIPGGGRSTLQGAGNRCRSL